MENSALDLEQKKVVSYLNRYGNTSESELIAYAAQKLSWSRDEARKIVDKMFLFGRIERVVHKELDPLVIYVKCGWTAEIERDMKALSESVHKGKTGKEKIEHVKEILKEAEHAAQEKGAEIKFEHATYSKKKNNRNKLA